MPDKFRIVSIGRDGRARLEQELNAVDFVYRQRDTFSVQPGAGTLRQAGATRNRYAGSIPLGEQVANGTITVTLSVKGRDPLEAGRRVEELLEALQAVRRELYLEWRPEGLERSAYSELRGPATQRPAYRPLAWRAGLFAVEVSWPVAPLPQGLPLEVIDSFKPPADKVGGNVNEVLNPLATFSPGAALPDGWGAFISAGTTLLPTGDLDIGRGGVAWQSAAFASNVAAFNIGRTGDGGGLNAVPVEPGQRIGMRFRFQVDSASGQAITEMQVQAQAFNAAGGAMTAAGLNPGEGEVRHVANPVTGTVYELAGYLDVPNDGTRRMTIRVRLQLANAGGTFDVRIGRAAFFYMRADETKVPAYGDGDGPFHRWEGERNRSRSIELEEDQLAEYTRIANPHPRQREAVGDGIGLIHYEAGGLESTLIHTGREPTPDHEALVVGRCDRAGAGGVIDYFLSPGVRWDPDTKTGFWATFQSGILRIFRRNRDGSNTVLASSAALNPALAVGRREALLCRAEGNTIIAERYTTTPNPGRANYATQLRYIIPPADVEEWGAERAGYPAPKCWAPPLTNVDSSPATSVIERFEARPYLYTGVRLPEAVVLRKVPGTAPALLDVGLAPYFTEGWPPVQAAFLAWRKRQASAYNMAWNGDAANGLVGGWHKGQEGLSPRLNASGAVGLVASSSGGPTADVFRYVAITSAAVTNSGAHYRIAGKFKRGQVYTVELYGYRFGGAASWEITFDLDVGAQVIAAVPFNPAGWGDGLQRFTFQPTEDRNILDVVFRFTPAGAGAELRVAGLRVYEGTRPPSSPDQRHGAGGVPPFGRIEAENYAMAGDQGSNNSGVPIGGAPLEVADPHAGAVASNGRILRVKAHDDIAAGANYWTFVEYEVDPALMPAGDFDDDELDVDAWLFFAPPEQAIRLRGFCAPSARRGHNSISGSFPGRSYTREFGRVGRKPPLGIPGGGASFPKVLHRLGTLTLSRSAGRYRIGVEMRADPPTGVYPNVDLDFLLLMPARQRMTSPTGRTSQTSDWTDGDPTYPRFMDQPAAGGNGYEMKVVKSNGDAVVETVPSIGGFVFFDPIVANETAAVPAVGLAGEPMLIDPGDGEVFAALWQWGVPDQPVEFTDGPGISHGTVRARITPRYRLLAPSEV